MRALSLMATDRDKRRRLCEVDCSRGGGDAPSSATLNDDVRTSLEEALSTLTLASRARENAATTLAQCEAAEASASQAYASTSAIARRLGVAADGEVGGLTLWPRASAPQRGSGGPIMGLPGVLIERIFDSIACLSDEYWKYRRRSFPCDPSLRHFAFTCRRFSEILRERYVKEVSVFSGLQLAKQAFVYREAITGALRRFCAADRLVVLGTECISQTAISFDFARVVPLHKSLLVYRLAVATRQSIASAISDDGNDGGNIADVCFGRESTISDFIHVINVSKDVIDVESVWGARSEEHRWLECLPNVKCVEFRDLVEFMSAPRTCGRSTAGVKTVKVRDIFISPCDADDVLLQFVRFQQIETLVFGGVFDPENLKVLQIPMIVDILPRLTALVLRFPDFDEFLRHDPPAMQYITRDPACGLDLGFLLQIVVEQYLKECHAPDPGSYYDYPENAWQQRRHDYVREFQHSFFGEFRTSWQINEMEWDTVDPKIFGRVTEDDLVVSIRFCSDD